MSSPISTTSSKNFEDLYSQILSLEKELKIKDVLDNEEMRTVFKNFCIQERSE
jgi:hypothetical protein